MHSRETNHPILKQFDAVFFERYRHLPASSIVVEDNPEADVMDVVISVETACGPAEFPFRLEGQGQMTEEEWGRRLRAEFRRWFRGKVAKGVSA